MALTTRKGAFSNPSKTTRQQIPPFLDKLYHMVNDPRTESLIRWSDTGDSFYVHDHERFANEVLPHWFKHRNFGSFVRQLNNYGFHKVPHLQQGVLRSDGDAEISHFENQYFQRGQSDLLNLIQRKKHTAPDIKEDSPDATEPVGGVSGQSNAPATESNQTTHNAKGAVLDINGLINGIQAIKRHQHAISSELKELHQSNQSLWQEAFAARERHKKHHDTITRILKFLAGVFGQSQGRTGTPQTNGMPHDKGGGSSSSTAVVPRRPNLLMIENSVELEGKPNDMPNDLNFNIGDLMEPLDFEGGQANDTASYAKIETPGSPGSSATKLESTPQLPTLAYPQDALVSPTSQTINKNTYPNLTSPTNHDRSPSPLAAPSPDFVLPPDTNSSVATSQSDQMVQNAITSLYNNPGQLQRVMSVLQSNLAVSMPPESSSGSYQVPVDTATTSPIKNIRPSADGRLSPNSTMSLLSAATNMGPLSAFSSADDPTLYRTLAQNENQLQKSYKDASEVEADVNTLQGHIDSLIESLGLDSNTSAALRGEHAADDDIVGSNNTVPNSSLPPHLADVNPDFDFEAFLSQDFGAGTGSGMVVGDGLDTVTQQNGAEQLGAFLDEVRSVSNESDSTHVSPPGETDTKSPLAKASTKRKSDVADIEDDASKKAALRPRKKR